MTGEKVFMLLSTRVNAVEFVLSNTGPSGNPQNLTLILRPLVFFLLYVFRLP